MPLTELLKQKPANPKHLILAEIKFDIYLQSLLESYGFSSDC